MALVLNLCFWVTMIPIPKHKRQSLCNSDNYRAIALSSIIGKILDWIILIKEEQSLSSSSQQFGFKGGTSILRVLLYWMKQLAIKICTSADSTVSSIYNRLLLISYQRKHVFLLKVEVSSYPIRSKSVIDIEWGRKY